jgi:hypothetical protein
MPRNANRVLTPPQACGLPRAKLFDLRHRARVRARRLRVSTRDRACPETVPNHLTPRAGEGTPSPCRSELRPRVRECRRPSRHTTARGPVQSELCRDSGCKRSFEGTRRASAAAECVEPRTAGRSAGAEPNAARLLDRELLASLLPDQPALELGQGGEHVRHRFPSRGRGDGSDR